MKRKSIRAFIFMAGAVGIVLAASSFGPATVAQTEPPNGPPPNEMQEGQNRQFPELGQALNLSREQRQQLFAVNQRTAPEFRQARMRMQLAQEELDEAVYNDVTDESVVIAKTKEFIQAQGEFTRLRTIREFRIRQILTPEQLARLREIRDRARNRNGGEPVQPNGEPINPNGERRLQRRNKGATPDQNFQPKPQPANPAPANNPAPVKRP
ncbi:MAG: periplasmic heavy metal sensor [Pyrinomonadaceae bacterium]